MASDDKVFKIMSYNMHGFYQGHPVIDDLVNTLKPDVILLQEHWLTPANLLSSTAEYTSNYMLL